MHILRGNAKSSFLLYHMRVCRYLIIYSNVRHMCRAKKKFQKKREDRDEKKTAYKMQKLSGECNKARYCYLFAIDETIFSLHYGRLINKKFREIRARHNHSLDCRKEVERQTINNQRGGGA